MARKKSTRKSAANGRAGKPGAKPAPLSNGGSLKLVRIDPRGGGLNFVFEDGGAERRWKLEAASAREFLALLLKGEMRKGRRMMTKDAEVSIEPPEKHQGPPVLCVSLGHVEICLALNRRDLGALGREIEQALGS